MKLETKRLELVPLLPQQLRAWIEDIAALEQALHCSYRAEPVEGLFLEIIKTQLDKAEKDPNNYMWHSFWFLIRKSDRAVIGSADFKDVPDADRAVEIGYGLGKAFEHNGYMTEAVQAMCAWALRQANVKHVLAETEIDGFASQRLLQRCGFREIKRGKTIWWQL